MPEHKSDSRGTDQKGYQPRDTTRGHQPQGSPNSEAPAVLPFGGSNVFKPSTTPTPTTSSDSSGGSSSAE